MSLTECFGFDEKEKGILLVSVLIVDENAQIKSDV